VTPAAFKFHRINVNYKAIEMMRSKSVILVVLWGAQVIPKIIFRRNVWLNICDLLCNCAVIVQELTGRNSQIKFF